VPSIGRERIKQARVRYNQLRRDTQTALERGEALQAEVDALRREVAATTTAAGEQIARLSEAIERLERKLTALARE
jgi:hypothetical protein